MAHFTQGQYDLMEDTFKRIMAGEPIAADLVHRIANADILSGFNENPELDQALEDVENVIDMHDEYEDDTNKIAGKLTDDDKKDVAEYLLSDFDYSGMNEEILDELKAIIEKKKGAN